MAEEDDGGHNELQLAVQAFEARHAQARAEKAGLPRCSSLHSEIMIISSRYMRISMSIVRWETS